MFCPNCGENSDGHRYCPYCGKSLLQAQDPAQDTDTAKQSDKTLNDVQNPCPPADSIYIISILAYVFTFISVIIGIISTFLFDSLSLTESGFSMLIMFCFVPVPGLVLSIISVVMVSHYLDKYSNDFNKLSIIQVLSIIAIVINGLVIVWQINVIIVSVILNHIRFIHSAISKGHYDDSMICINRMQRQCPKI